MKKFLSILLVMTLLFTLFVIPAHAEEPEIEPLSGCPHNWEFHNSYTVGVYLGASGHRLDTYDLYICSICGVTDRRLVSRGLQTLSHSGYYTSASCNGTVQTHNKYCTTCYHAYTVTMYCPARPHTGGCSDLPV